MSAPHQTGRPENGRPPHAPHRRSFLKASGALTLFASFGSVTFSAIAYADALTKEQRDQMSPDDILALMKKGNQRFTSGQRAGNCSRWSAAGLVSGRRLGTKCS